MSNNDLMLGDDVVDDGDFLGGGGGYVWESGVYPVVIDLAYLSKSSEGATGLNLVLKDENAKELKTTLWIKSKDSKGNKPYYEKDGKKHALQGMNMANALAGLAVPPKDGKVNVIGDLDRTEKTVAIWDYDASAELNTKVEVFMDLIDKRVDVGVIRRIENKRKQQGGQWVDTADKKDSNELAAVFDADTGLSITEYKAGATDPEFKAKWLKRWDGKTDDKYKEVAGNGSSAGAPSTAPTTTKKLFK